MGLEISLEVCMPMLIVNRRTKMSYSRVCKKIKTAIAHINYFKPWCIIRNLNKNRSWNGNYWVAKNSKSL
jgi:hypothetical protein